jgi:hypothetical protein
VKKDEEISAIPLSDVERKDHVPGLLQQAIGRAHGKQLTAEDDDAAQLHGRVRRKQGYSIPLVVREARILLRAIADCVQQNLLAIEVSYLIPDMVNVWETVSSELEISIKTFLASTGGSAASDGHSADASRAHKAPRSSRS